MIKGAVRGVLNKKKLSKRGSKEEVQLYRLAGVEIIYAIMEEGAYANLHLNKQLRVLDLSRGERKLLTDIVNGTVRMAKYLDGVLDVFLKKPIAEQNP